MTSDERIAGIRRWRDLLAARFDPSVAGYVADVGFLLDQLTERDAQLAVIERAPTEPHPTIGAAAFGFWNAALAQAELAIATEFGRARLAARNLYDAERQVQGAVRALRRSHAP